MDIRYLLFLQDIRESMPDFVNMIFYFISEFGVSCGMIIPMFAFWCVSKKDGFFYSLSFSGATYVSQFIKNTACIYRPWVRDNAVRTFEKSFGSATGYSFPSGHSTTAASVFGGGAVVYKKKKSVAILLVAFALLVGFSRNYLGCHTPQDVVVGLSIGFLFLIVSSFLVKWVATDAKRDKWLLVGGGVLAVLMLLFCELKSYPIDFAADGSLICDPEPMKFDCYQAAGYLFGLVLAWFLEKRFVNFEIEGVWWKKLIRMIFGFAVFAVLHFIVGHALRAAIGDKIGKMVVGFNDQMFTFLIYPAVLKLIQKIAAK